MSGPPEPAVDDRGDDAEDLRRLGYTQELARGMGAFSSFALSFSIISILTGAVVLYGHGLQYGGVGEQHARARRYSMTHFIKVSASANTALRHNRGKGGAGTRVG